MFVSNQLQYTFEQKTQSTNWFFLKNQLVFWVFFPSEGITSDATWMYYVKANKTQETVSLNQWFLHANPDT